MPTEQKRQTKGTLARLRALVPNRSLTPSERASVIERQAIQLRRILDVQSDSFPIEAIETIPRVRILPQPDLQTSACAFWTGAHWTILVNTAEAPTRQRFSALHELHHVISHPLERQLFGSSGRHSDAAERCADLFAAHVLMPRLLVKRHWGRGPREVSTMANRFEVSTQAMNFRLAQLGLTEPSKRCAWTSNNRALSVERMEVA